MSETSGETTEMTTEMTNNEKVEEVVIEIESETGKKTSPKVVIPDKRIDELTDEEKKILIDNARAGIENPYFNVKLFKNGNTRICKKKRTIANQAVTSKGETTVKTSNGEQKVYMTDNQLMWQHILDIQDKYHTLNRKYKKLKGRYKELYIEDEITPYEQEPQPKEPQQQQPKEQPKEPQQKTPYEQPIQQQQQPQQPIFRQNQRSNWRASLIQNMY